MYLLYFCQVLHKFSRFVTCLPCDLTKQPIFVSYHWLVFLILSSINNFINACIDEKTKDKKLRYKNYISQFAITLLLLPLSGFFFNGVSA